jgi:hypothetical protein
MDEKLAAGKNLHKEETKAKKAKKAKKARVCYVLPGY